jgi:hypothetical protein
LIVCEFDADLTYLTAITRSTEDFDDTDHSAGILFDMVDCRQRKARGGQGREKEEGPVVATAALFFFALDCGCCFGIATVWG